MNSCAGIEFGIGKRFDLKFANIAGKISRA